ncbi:pentapeptide repeat-containing protein [Tahibacter amnicola]|uniref:Pentapeptide repeat-containing protein n=1 Tax=Tahibacter amnicola TaxID=2976241 RepID=A0ABY6BAM4_9GAMM|nr:pentapeptide repeat-containing protein [Tahibacter amnicola]UXI66200.1 pentapeptide repeat-containing protein [Tahibacter amnicola]
MSTAIPLRNSTYAVSAYDTNLTGSTFEDTLLANATFKYASMERANFELVRFDGATMSNVSFENVSMERVSFVNCAIRHGRYSGMTIDGIPVDVLLKNYYSANA